MHHSGVNSFGREKGDATVVSFFAGPTGGHLFPAVALAEQWRVKHESHKIHLITGKRAKKFIEQLPEGTFDKVVYLSEFPFLGKNPLQLIPFCLKFFLALFSSSKYLSQNKPHACVGFGSFISYPGMVLAACRKIPTVLHEQNVIPGKANEWLVKWVDCVTVSFERTWKEKSLKHLRVVGLPIRKELVLAGNLQADRILKKENDHDLFRILLMGGSQGARKLNAVFLEALELLTPEEKSKIAVTHITGMTDYDLMVNKYQKVEVKHQVIAFSDKIHECYGDADMAITRAGANTLFELALFKLPALVIPYPHAGSHQNANAAYFESKGGVFSCPESMLKPSWIVEKIRLWMKQPEVLKECRQRISELTRQNAAEDLLKIVEGYFYKEELCELSNKI